jgi:hypothetical protein
MTKRMLRFLGIAAFSVAPALCDITIYNSNPSQLPGNVPSLGYEATSTTEFGGLIQFAAGPRDVTSAIVTMSNWALESDYETVGTSAGYTHPLTLNLYNVGTGNTVGSLIGSETISAFVPWRPEASSSCGTGWLDSNGGCWNGLAFQVSFDFGGLAVPDQIIYGLAFDTGDYGNPKIGKSGPYNSLNFGLAVAPPSVGANPLPDTAYVDSTWAGLYTDGGAAGVGTFRQDTNWAPYSGAIEFRAASVPEPGTLLLLGLMIGCVGAFGLFRRKRA